MNTKIQKTALLSILFTTTGFIQSIQAEKTDIQISAHALSYEECLSTFYRNIHEYRIFPVRIGIKNDTEKAVTLSPEDILIEKAKLLTPKTLESKIYSTSLGAGLMTIIVFPIGLMMAYQLKNLQAIQPIINQNSFPDEPVIIHPEQAFETMLFAEFDYPKDIDGKSQKFVAPQALDITLTLKSTIYLLFESKTVLNINVPIS